MRIAIVNNAAMAVEALRRVVASDSNHDVAWVANNGAEAIAQCARDLPDLVLMDLPLPQIDGVEATRQIMKQTPCPILIVTAAVEKNASKVFQAMGHGALDAVNTPALGLDGSAADAQALLGKIDTIGRLSGKSRRRSDGTSGTKTIGQSRDQIRPQSERMQQSSSRPLAGTLGNVPPLIAIGCSTGGPMALATILSALPADFRAAIAIIQHVDVQFSSGMATWLNRQTSLEVELAAEGARLQAGKVLIAGTNDHLVLKRSLTLTYTPEPKDYPYRPSVDAFFRSAAQYWPQPATAVLLTGMGRDGAEGLGLLRDAGWHTIAQDQASSVVYGMPKAAAERGAAVEILPLTAIAPALIRQATRNS